MQSIKLASCKLLGQTKRISALYFILFPHAAVESWCWCSCARMCVEYYDIQQVFDQRQILRWCARRTWSSSWCDRGTVSHLFNYDNIVIIGSYQMWFLTSVAHFFTCFSAYSNISFIWSISFFYYVQLKWCQNLNTFYMTFIWHYDSAAETYVVLISLITDITYLA